jgi:hypothetical protein
LRVIEQKIEDEIKAGIKAEFDYQIPIAEIEKAGISTTGTAMALLKKRLILSRKGKAYHYEQTVRLSESALDFISKKKKASIGRGKSG